MEERTKRRRGEVRRSRRKIKVLVKKQPLQKLDLTFSVVFFQETNDLHHLCLGLLELRKESSSQTELVIIFREKRGKTSFCHGHYLISLTKSLLALIYEVYLMCNFVLCSFSFVFLIGF